ncbi:aspartate/glutamate racemase family protein [Nocardioides sp. SLBN-35]|jgi:Asp/Glu/hydantoin racemase|uniref:aspartate/glutamate racemase family protein n=1 Tax=Nocardioides sp. SLBN-35 TaxID=2768445 RepID=UPI00115498BA|nr:aspartate/glutamate racemase family protein [Nocardioides sp. SLBN-35]TQK72443.1 Asp/Glu/hydantoin racemase [Nocardioides sp. SLBN-35]
MTRRIAYVYPGPRTPDADTTLKLVSEFASPETTVETVFLEGVPPDIEGYASRQFTELALLRLLPSLQDAGFDAAAIGCCYDPAVLLGRELVDMPLVGPLEASINLASYVGRTYSILTDGPKVAAWLGDLLNVYRDARCRGIHSLDLDPHAMFEDVPTVCTTTASEVRRIMAADGSDVVVLGCTVIGDCLAAAGSVATVDGDLPVINPVLASIKAAEMLADLYRAGRYSVSRQGFYASSASSVEALGFELSGASLQDEQGRRIA